jgi:hypothetical protein
MVDARMIHDAVVLRWRMVFHDPASGVPSWNAHVRKYVCIVQFGCRENCHNILHNM